jgi:hypothetical protein
MFKRFFKETKRSNEARLEQRQQFDVATGYRSVSEDVAVDIVNGAKASFRDVMRLKQVDFSKFENNRETMDCLDRLEKIASGEASDQFEKKTWDDIGKKVGTNTSLREALNYIANVQATSKSYIDTAYAANIDRENTDIALAFVRGMDQDMYTKLTQFGLSQERKNLVLEKVREMSKAYHDEDKAQITDKAEEFLGAIPGTP